MTTLEKLREPRIDIAGMKIAVFDLSATLIVGYIIGKKMFKVNGLVGSIGLLGLGIVVHEVMDIETEISKKIKG